MAYSRKMLENDERRERIATELAGRKWPMTIKTVAETYVFFEHPEFKDHVFCSSSIIPSRPLVVGERMEVEVELAFDKARNCYGYVAKSALRPQDIINVNEHKTEFENMAAVIQKLLSKSETVTDEAAWKKLLPAGWDWSLAFTRGHVKELRTLCGKLTQCGALLRLHNVLNTRTVYDIRDIFDAHYRALHALSDRFERTLERLSDR